MKRPAPEVPSKEVGCGSSRGQDVLWSGGAVAGRLEVAQVDRATRVGGARAPAGADRLGVGTPHAGLGRKLHGRAQARRGGGGLVAAQVRAGRADAEADDAGLLTDQLLHGTDGVVEGPSEEVLEFVVGVHPAGDLADVLPDGRHLRRERVALVLPAELLTPGLATQRLDELAHEAAPMQGALLVADRLAPGRRPAGLQEVVGRGEVDAQGAGEEHRVGGALAGAVEARDERVGELLRERDHHGVDPDGLRLQAAGLVRVPDVDREVVGDVAAVTANLARVVPDLDHDAQRLLRVDHDAGGEVERTLGRLLDLGLGRRAEAQLLPVLPGQDAQRRDEENPSHDDLTVSCARA